MNVPFIMLSYDEFQQSRKLFSYERDGIHTLPIFTDPARAMKFAKSMTETLSQQFNDKRTLRTQLCTDRKLAVQMFETITAYFPNLMQVIVDPHPPVCDDQAITDLSTLSWLETVIDIDDVLLDLHESVKAEPESKGQ